MNEALAYFDLCKFPFWQIEKSPKERLNRFDEGDIVQSRNHLQDSLALLPPGRYVLKIWRVKNGEGGTQQHEFTIKGETQQATNNSMQAPANFQELIEKARLQGFQEGHEKATVENRLSAVEKDITEIKRILFEQNNDDPNDDKDALSKIRDFSAAIPDITTAWKHLKG